MAKSAVYLFAIVAVTVIVESSGQSSSPRCPVNQIWLDCPKPKSCRLSCKQAEDPEACLAVCDPAGCACQEGYLLNDKGECVEPSKCPNGAPVCPPNKVWSDCPPWGSCRPACSPPNGPDNCPAVCDKPGCVCKAGLVLNANGECIEKSKCPPRCPANSTYSGCPLRKSCRPSCDKPSGAEFCTLECDLANPCVCDPGYLLNKEGKCIRPSDCPNGSPVCPANQVWSDCAKLRSCRPSCSQLNGAAFCPTVCVADCVCKAGLVLNANGECIEKSKCPPRCPANSTYSGCPLRKSCRPSCENLKGTPACTKECDLANPCVCNPGYVLNSKGECVSKC